MKNTEKYLHLVYNYKPEVGSHRTLETVLLVPVTSNEIWRKSHLNQIECKCHIQDDAGTGAENNIKNNLSSNRGHDGRVWQPHCTPALLPWQQPNNS